jgi:PKD repeat protein
MDIPRKFMVILIIAIILTASGSLAFNQMIQGNLNPIVKAHADQISGTVPLTIHFSCNCYDPDGAIEQILWKFGDGSTSDKKTVNHTYQWKGHFTVVLTVWDDDGVSSYSTLDILVDDNSPPDVFITANSTYGHAPLKISFSAEGYDDGYITSYLWDFDDGQNSISQQPTHWFNETGKYLVSCTAKDTDGLFDTSFIEIMVAENQAPEVFITANKKSGPAPMIVQFTSNVIDEDSNIHQYQWTFDDRMLQKYRGSTEKNCTHWFFTPGIYKIDLTVTDDKGLIGHDIAIIEIHESYYSNMISCIQNKISNRILDWFMGLLPWNN